MSEHRISSGRLLIRGLTTLGRALGYHVELEFPVAVGDVGPAMAVDVAWFGGPSQAYPLMIFEVESGAGNTIANNPLKVFAQDSRRFEKPLFYFQLIVQGGRATQRVQLLERQYGTHNYRLYRLADGAGTQFAQDVLRQHRRIRGDCDYVSLFEALASPGLSQHVDALAVIDEAVSLALSPQQHFPAMLRLARRHEQVREQLSPLVDSAFNSGWRVELETFLGQWWGPAFLMAWQVGQSQDLQAIGEWDRRLLAWQRNDGDIPRFCTEVGLSHDYAEFFYSLGGPFVAALVGLGGGRGAFAPELLSVLTEGIGRMRPHWAGLQLALWSCHVAARLQRERDFDVARDFINRSGGVASTDLYSPPSSVPAGEGSRDDWFESSGVDTWPDMSTFLKELRVFAHHGNTDATGFVLAVLDDESHFMSWGDGISDLLWRDHFAIENQ